MSMELQNTSYLVSFKLDYNKRSHALEQNVKIQNMLGFIWSGVA